MRGVKILVEADKAWTHDMMEDEYVLEQET